MLSRVLRSAFSLAALAAITVRVDAAGSYDFNNFTLDAPPAKDKTFTSRQAASIRDHWDKHGVLRVAILSDHNLNYEFWSGLQLIELDSKKVYNVNAVRCVISFCIYVGKLRPGKYLINHLYAHQYTPSQFATPERHIEAPIRNMLGSFEIKVRALTDLGLIGVHRGVEAAPGRSFMATFLGYHAEIGTLYEETYRGYRKYFGLGDTVLHWDENEWLNAALKAAPARRLFYADLSRSYLARDELLFPTALGAIYELAWDRGFSARELPTMFMLTALHIDGDAWTVGSEAGRLYRSQDGGLQWTAHDSFARDEVVVQVFSRAGRLHVVTVSEQQELAKLYAASSSDGGFSLVSSTSFELSDKSSAVLAAMDQAKESLTEIFFNREDLKKVAAQVLGEHLILKLNAEQIASYSFAKNEWHAVEPDFRIRTFFARDDAVYLMSEPYELAESSPTTRDRAKQRFGESERVPVVTIQRLTPDLRQVSSSQELFARPRGGLHVQADGSHIAVLSAIETPEHLMRSAATQLYHIRDNANLTAIRSVSGLGFYYDAQLLSRDSDWILIDRVAPRVHRLKADGSAETYRLYARAEVPE